MSGTLSTFAAKQTGKEEYPPIPKTKFGLLFNKKINDLNTEKKIINIEINDLKIFFLKIVEEAILTILRLL